MSPTSDAETTDLRDAVLEARQSIRHLRTRDTSDAGELAEAEERYKALAREYAALRIAEGLAPEPEVIDRATLEEVLDTMSRPDPFATKIKKTEPSCLSRGTVTVMLTSGADLGDILKALTASSAADSFDQQAPLRRLIRKSAEPTRTDPFIDQCLRAVDAHLADFSKAIRDAASVLNSLRVKYEIEHHGAEELALERGPEGKIKVIASNTWEAMEKAFPADAREVYANIAVADLAAERIGRATQDINRELSRFFAEFVPRLFSLIASLPRPKRRQRTSGIKLTPTLAARLVEAAEATDFVADPASGLGFKRQPLPQRFRLLTTRPGYEQVRKAVVGNHVQDARTVVARRPRPTPQPE